MARKPVRNVIVLRTKMFDGEYVAIFTIKSGSSTPIFSEAYIRSGTTQDLIDRIRKRYGLATIDFYKYNKSIR